MRQHYKQIGDEGPCPAATATVIEDINEQQVRNMYRFMYRHVGNREEAEELTARACSRAMRARQAATARHLSDVPLRKRMESYLRQTARSVVEEHLRSFYHSSAHSLASDDTIDWSDVTASQGIEQATSVSDRIGHILAQLPARDRELLTHRFLHNDSLAKTAASMRITLADALQLQWSALTHAADVASNEAGLRRPAKQ